jgi:hypothetical protein
MHFIFSFLQWPLVRTSLADALFGSFERCVDTLIALARLVE